MTQRKPLTIVAPILPRELSLPRALKGRLDELLDKQDLQGKLAAKEQREAAALVELSELVSLLRLSIKAANGRG